MLDVCTVDRFRRSVPVILRSRLGHEEERIPEVERPPPSETQERTERARQPKLSERQSPSCREVLHCDGTDDRTLCAAYTGECCEGYRRRPVAVPHRLRQFEHPRSLREQHARREREE